MKTIKKTTLIAAVAAMAAFAVPSMASAATWAPLNTNKTLTSTSQVEYITGSYGFYCSNSSLGVHVRTPASGTLDITSASFTGCTNVNNGIPCGPATVTATGLPWTATSFSVSGVTITEHLQVSFSGCGLAGYPFTVDGPFTGSYNNATHTLSGHPTPPMALYIMGTWVDNIIPATHTWHETTNTLTLT